MLAFPFYRKLSISVRQQQPVSYSTVPKESFVTQNAITVDIACYLKQTNNPLTMSWFNKEEGYFLYFSYGSNLDSTRIHLNNPSAVAVGKGILKDYDLAFGTLSSRKSDPLWTGGTATIVEKKGVNVWGVVWKIDLAAVSNLDRQEDVYLPKEVTIEMTDGTSLLCRTYQLDRLTLMAPMPAYKQVCIEGAREHGLPDYYIQKLMAIQDNGDTKTLTPTMVKMAEAKKD